MEEHERRRAGSFGEDPLAYDRTRPSYPDALVDHLLAVTDRPRPRVLDVGCGTGKAARLFAERGCDVLGVEHDPRMADVARSHGLAVDVARFEDWDPAGRTFDLVVAAQAWHWIDQAVGAAQAAAVLPAGGGGHLALFWNMLEHEPGIRPALDAVYAGFPELVRPVAMGLRAERTPIEGLGPGWGPQEVRVDEWTRRHTRDEWLDQLPTHSDHRLLPPDRLATLLDLVGAAIDADGGTLTLRYETVCWIVPRA